MTSPIYKILSLTDDAAFAAAPEAGYAGSSDDARDGYIHFSTREQLAGTLAAHYRGLDEVMLLTVVVEGLPSIALKWEESRGGQLFPHLYAVLPGRAVLCRDRLRRGTSGLFVLPWETH
ncbi:DUF952 domain-containing protein [Govanella unica]|uniref:DUF952 domain-containing protein n=1 Tax=Govanella unica TaxID=2975056 RepID=A0A9X3U080_9PROT|nr:DUF952 domain-containing protein [Govania unica]MDA5194692.1 DUF952 domain-containing protein [Govania unica]